jgi:spore coat polysaccharide biosynthesis predicted glycosyltransferase SpsG
LGVPRIDDYEIKNAHVVVTEHGELSRTGLPHMDDEFINALTEADVVVGAPTTLMLEAMLVGRPCVLDITSDKFHRTTAGNAAQRYTHMRDLLAVRDLARGETIDQLISAVNKVLDAGPTKVSYEIEHLYDTGGLSYAEHLTSILLA